MPIDINSTFQPRNDGDFPVNEARFIQAAALTVADLTARNDLLVKPGRLEVGQLAWVVSEGKLYSLDAGKASWTEVTLGNPNAVTTDRDRRSSESRDLQAELSAVITDRDLLFSETQSLRSELGAMIRSTSWQITKPLRRSTEFMRSSLWQYRYKRPIDTQKRKSDDLL